MKRLSMYVPIMLLFSLNVLAQDNRSIQISLTRVEGNFPFGNTSVFTQLVSDKESYKGIPSGLKEYVIHQCLTTMMQFNYEQYHTNKMPKHEFLEMLKKTDVDTLNLSRNHVKQDIIALVGTDSDGKRIVIVDANQNQDFSDDKKIVYEMPYPGAEINNGFYEAKAIDEIVKSIPSVQTEIEYFSGGKIFKTKLFVKPNPYNYNVTYKDSLQQRLFLMIMDFEHREGKVVLNNIKYKVAVTNNRPMPTYNKKYSLLKIIKEGENFPTDGKSMSISTAEGEVINLDNHDYKFSSVTRTGDSLTLEYIGFNNRPSGYNVGLYAPEISAKDINNKNFELDKYKGRYVLLDFWGTWCGPCLKAIPQLKSFSQKYKGKKLEIVSLAYENDTTLIKLQKAIKENAMNWTHLYQPLVSNTQATIKKKYGIKIFPTTFLISPEGKIIFKGGGLKDIEALAIVLEKELK